MNTTTFLTFSCMLVGLMLVGGLYGLSIWQDRRRAKIEQFAKALGEASLAAAAAADSLVRIQQDYWTQVQRIEEDHQRQLHQLAEDYEKKLQDQAECYLQSIQQVDKSED